MKALGELNFRDVGGLAAEGGTIRHGLLYRSEGPASFGDDHRSELAALGFKTVCDLRSGAERSEHPNDLVEDGAAPRSRCHRGHPRAGARERGERRAQGDDG